MSSDLLFTIQNRKWILQRPNDLESLWEAMGQESFQDEERIPYWVELWPASLALVHFLYEKQETIRGKICLDMGCGLGLSTCVGAELGAFVIGIDYEIEALQYARKNSLRNGVAKTHFLAMDWRYPAIQEGSCDIIWGSDIMYEQQFLDPICSFIQKALRPAGEVWFADPRRNIFPLFLEKMEALSWKAYRVHSAAYQINPNAVSSQVDVWCIKR